MIKLITDICGYKLKESLYLLDSTNEVISLV